MLNPTANDFLPTLGDLLDHGWKWWNDDCTLYRGENSIPPYLLRWLGCRIKTVPVGDLVVILRELNLSLKPESLPSVDELLDQGWKWWYDGSSLFHERTGQDIDSRLVGWLGKELSSVPEPDLSRILRVTDLVGSEVYD